MHPLIERTEAKLFLFRDERGLLRLTRRSYVQYFRREKAY
jgi:hypothetical protein